MKNKTFNNIIYILSFISTLAFIFLKFFKVIDVSWWWILFFILFPNLFDRDESEDDEDNNTPFKIA